MKWTMKSTLPIFGYFGVVRSGCGLIVADGALMKRLWNSAVGGAVRKGYVNTVAESVELLKASVRLWACSLKDWMLKTWTLGGK